MPEAPVIDGETSGDGPEGRGVQAVIAALKAAYQERVSTAHAVREQHANTVTWSKPKLPDAVLFAENTGDVRHAVSLCAAHAVPIVRDRLWKAMSTQRAAGFQSTHRA